MFTFVGIVNIFLTTKMNLGERLKIERERIGLSQASLADATGVSRTSQFNYESAERSPDADYLAVAASLGVDVAFVITGERHDNVAQNLNEIGLLRTYRALASADAESFKIMLSAFCKSKGVDIWETPLNKALNERIGAAIDRNKKRAVAKTRGDRITQTAGARSVQVSGSINGGVISTGDENRDKKTRRRHA